MSYAVKEIYYTLQGEGANVGRPAVFLRFAGCNLWSGREEDRAAAVCDFCDTDFVGTDGPGGGKFAGAAELADAVAALWPHPPSSRMRAFVVCTGGEPLLQLDRALDRRPAPRGVRDRRRNERNDAAATGDRLGMRQPEGACGPRAPLRATS